MRNLHPRNRTVDEHAAAEWNRRRFLEGAAVAGAALAGVGPLAAQPPAKEAEKPLPPEDVSLETADGVNLAATYYPSKKGKEATPVLLLHDDQKDVATRKVYAELALYLQSKGCACLALDLRGFGGSNSTASGKKISEKDVNKLSLTAMASSFGKGGGDLETAKTFLLAKNNLGELNVNKLVVVAAGMSAAVAMNWAGLDWAWPSLPGRPKQGQDVKALVLLSPLWSYKGYSIEAVINNSVPVQRQLSYMICVGDRKASAKEVKEANQVYDRLKPFHPEPDANKPEEVRDKKDLFFDAYKTEFQGTRLLGKNLGIEARIERFIELRATSRAYPWSDRT